MPVAPPAEPQAHAWGLQEAVVVGIQSALALIHHRGSDLPVGATAADVAGLWVGLVGAVVLAGRRHGRGQLGSDYGLVMRPVDLVIGAVVGVGSQLAVIPALYWPLERLDPSLGHDLSAPAQRDIGAVHSWPALVVLLAVLAVGAPLVEELFFRGLVLRALAGRLPVPAAVVVSGLAFALAHFEAAQFAGLALFGVILGVLAWRSGRLGPGIAAHAAFNAVAVASVVRLH